MYRTLDTLLNNSNKVLPTCVSDEALSNNFANFFTDKVSIIRAELDDESANVNMSSSNRIVHCDKSSDSSDNMCNNTIEIDGDINMCNRIANFRPVDTTEVQKVISKIPNKTSALDPLPTWLLKDCSDIMTPIIVSLINNTFSAGCFPSMIYTLKCHYYTYY